MVCAAVVEIVRQRNAPPPGNYFNQRAVDNISPCQNIDDFNPFIYQQWQAGLTDSQPNYCTQTCNNTFYSVEDSMALLNLTCIDCDNIPQTSNLSVLWQIPQFTLIGISEILASITSIEFFYSQAPLPLRSICQALNTGTQALGAISLVPLIYAVNSIPSEMWLPSNLDTGYLDYYFFLLSVVMVIDWLLLLWISRGFQYKTEEQLSCKLDNSELDAILFSPYQRDASGEHSGDMTDSLLKHKQQIQ